MSNIFGTALVHPFITYVLLRLKKEVNFRLTIRDVIYILTSIFIVVYCAFTGISFLLKGSILDATLMPIFNYLLLSLFMIPVAFIAGLGSTESVSKKFGGSPISVLRGTNVVTAQEIKSAQSNYKEDLSLNIKWGGVAIDYNRETEHFLISGKTGSGKTQAINEILRTAKSRNNEGHNNKAIIADPAGGYLARFGHAQSLILNPFDKRSVEWSPFSEIHQVYDCQRLALAAIPNGNGNSAEWNTYAQTLLTELFKIQWKAGNYSLRELLRLANTARPAELDKLLRDTPAGAFTALDNERMLGSIRSVMASYLASWEYLPDRGSFSIREWVKGVDQNNTEWLYITYMDNQLTALKSLIGCWLEIAIVEGLSLPENPERRLFYVMDEMDSLGKVPSLRLGVTKLRKYGGVCVGGLQTIAQLRSTYGKDEAQTLLSSMSTKLLLAAGDNETAEYFSHEIGEQEIQRTVTSKGQSTSGTFSNRTNSTSTNTSIERKIERAVLPSEISSLPNLNGFLKPVGQPVIRIQLDYLKMPDAVAPFIA